jgi:hypothetical protein
MVAIYTMCAWIAWAPAWDFTLEQDVEAHYFYEDALPGVVAFFPEIEVCQPEGEWDVPHIYSVAGFVDDGEGGLLIGPESDDLTVIWPSEPVPEPSGTMMLMAGIVALAFLSRRRRNR